MPDRVDFFPRFLTESAACIPRRKRGGVPIQPSERQPVQIILNDLFWLRFRLITPIINMPKIIKSGYLSDLNNKILAHLGGFLYYGTLTIDDHKITFEGRGHVVWMLKSFKIVIPINTIQMVSLKNYLIHKYVYIEFVHDGQIKKVMIRPLKFPFLKLFDESDKWKHLILEKIHNKF